MLGNRLPQILAERGLSIRELARRTGVTYTTIWAVVHSERRSVQLEVLEAICLVLATQPGDIYFITTGDSAPAAIPAIPAITTSLEDKKEEIDRQVVKDGSSQIQTEQNRRPAKPGNDWRSW